MAKEEALQKVAVLPGTDIAAFASIPSNRMIRSVSQLKELKLTMTGVDEGVFFLDGDRQSFQDRVLIIRKELVSDLLSQYQGQRMSEEIKKYLEPTPSIQSDHPDIQAKVKENISPTDPLVVKTRKLVEWVYKSLQKRPVLSVPNALDRRLIQEEQCHDSVAECLL